MNVREITESAVSPEKIYYHGTNKQFTNFDLDAAKENRATNVTGIYFTPREQEAREFGQRVIAATLSVNRPFDINKQNKITQLMLDKYKELLLRYTNMKEQWIDSVKVPEFEEKGSFTNSMFDLSGDIKREILLAGGYDSYIDGVHVVVLNPSSENINLIQTVKERRAVTKKIVEGLSPVLYHATSVASFFSILRSNKIKLSRDFLSKGRFYMSFSRNKSNDFLSYLSSLRDYELDDDEAFNPRKDPYVVIEFDGQSLSQNYSGKSFNTFYDPDDDYGSTPDFMEDRLVTNKPFIPNATRYIRGVSLVLNGADLANKKLLELVTRYGSNLFVYNDTKSYIAGRPAERNSKRISAEGK